MELKKLIAWLVFILGAVLLIGGVYVSAINIQADSNISLFGQKIGTVSVGVAIIFIGSIMVVTTFKKLLGFSGDLSVENNRDTLGRLTVITHEENDETKGIGDATVILSIPPEPQKKKSDSNGSTIFFFPIHLVGTSIKINGFKEHYKVGKPKTVKLKSNSLIYLCLNKDHHKQNNIKVNDDNILSTTESNNYGEKIAFLLFEHLQNKPNKRKNRIAAARFLSENLRISENLADEYIQKFLNNNWLKSVDSGNRIELAPRAFKINFNKEA